MSSPTFPATMSLLAGRPQMLLSENHIHRSDWLRSSIWSGSTTARCCLGPVLSHFLIKQLNGPDYPVSIAFQFWPPLQPGSMLPVCPFSLPSARSLPPGQGVFPSGSKSPILWFFPSYFQNLPTRIMKPLPHFIFRTIFNSDYKNSFLTHLHTHPRSQIW